MAKTANFNGVIVTHKAQAIQFVGILASLAYIVMQQKDQHEN